MAIKYNGIKLTAPVAATPFAATPTYALHVIVTASTGPAFIVGANGTQMAILATGVPFAFGGTDPITGEPINLADYQASAAAGDVYIAFAARS